MLKVTHKHIVILMPFFQNAQGHIVFLPNEGLQTSPSLISQQIGVTNPNAVRGNRGSTNGGFSKGLGQCGRRNAHSVNGRVSSGRFNSNEGETDFGEIHESLFI